MAPEAASVSTNHHQQHYQRENKHLLQASKKSLSKKALKLQTLILFIALIISGNNLDGIHCETKEFDWGDLGVSLANNKAPYNGAGNNLRILVSPAQRRMTKNSYEFDYVNNSQPISSQGEASYIIPGSSNSYLTQPSSQTSHSAAYSALSASLATLKNRLSARGVSLSSSLGDPTSQTNGLYQNPAANAYGSTLLTDSQSSSSVTGQHQGQTQGQSQPTYLSVTNHQVDQQTSGGGSYASGQSQGTDNKTIVLAIPAKINFLTDGRTGANKQQQQHHQQSQSQQAQQQMAGDQQQARSAQDAYGNSKQLGLMSGQDNVATVDPASHLVGRDTSGSPVADQEHQHQQQQQQQQQLQQHHQYVLVNSSPVAPVSEHSQLVTGTGLQSPQPTSYTQLYPAPGALQTQGPTTGYAVKYIPTYQTNIPQPTVPRLYSTGETGIGYSEAQIEEQYGRYGGCIDTCNSADIRWRKYSVSKYKYCCSRSSQYDAQFEQPLAEKLNENSKQADDAFYNYMYRRTRSRRSRRPGSRYSSRYHHKQASSSIASNPNEDGSSGDGESVGGGVRMTSRDSPYMRYHKNRPSTSSYGSTDLHDSISTGTNSGNKYTSKERSYRRGRSRDFDTIDPSHQSYDSQDDETMGSYQSDSQGSRGAGPSSSTYGGGDESVGSGGRYSTDGQVNEEDDVRTPSAGYGADEPSDTEMDKNTPSGIADGSDYPEEMGADKQIVGGEEGEPETTNAATYKYTANRRKKQGASGKGSRLRKGSNGKYRKARKNRLNKQASAATEPHSSSNNGQVNGTEYDSSSQADQYNNNNQELSGSTNGNNNNNYDDEKQYSGKDSNDSSENADKEAVSFSNRLKSMGLNDSAVVNLSKTTMHLKEILSILEKKAQLKANESASSSSNGQTTQSPLTTTSSTTSFYPLSLLGSQYANSAPLQLPSDYLTTELSMKSPYRYEPPSLSSSLSLPTQSYPPMNLDSYSSLASPYGSANQFAGLSSKHLNYAAAAAAAAAASGHHPRKRRTNKHVRYNHNLMMSKPHGLQSASSLLHHSAFAKNPLLSSAYYSSLHYPYQYTPRGTYSSYPYKNLNKNFYQSSLNGAVSSKMASNSGLYSDETRLHGMSSLDPLANVASSLRPSTTMRLRSKQFLFQPHVSPIYNRHNILTQPVDKK